MPLERHPTDPDKLVFRGHRIPIMFTEEDLDAAVAAEREACARTVYDATDNMHEERDMVLKDIIVDAIKARGQS